MVLICILLYAFSNVKMCLKFQIKSTDCAFTLALHAEKYTEKYTKNAKSRNFCWNQIRLAFVQIKVWFKVLSGSKMIFDKILEFQAAIIVPHPLNIDEVIIFPFPVHEILTSHVTSWLWIEDGWADQVKTDKGSDHIIQDWWFHSLP